MDDSQAECGLCSQEVGEDAIGCDSCSGWFHARPDCTGLSVNAISVIQNEGGQSISFKCSRCICEQSNTGASPSNRSDLDTGLI